MFEVSYTQNGLRVSFAATLDNIDKVAREARKFLSANNARHHVFDVTLVLREGLVNAVVDGRRLDTDRPVDFSLTLYRGILTMEIEDHGSGFDWRRHGGGIPAPESESGRGLAIMAHYCDIVEFNDKGNKVTLKKRLDPSFAGPRMGER